MNPEMKETKQSNKENEDHHGNLLSSSTKSNSAFNSLWFPKRSCELPAFESDSEEEDNICNDNLNCAAILDESFILTPMKTEQLSALKDSTSSSFVSRFKEIKLEGVKDPSDEKTELATDERRASSTQQLLESPQLPRSFTSTTKKEELVRSGVGVGVENKFCRSLQPHKEDYEQGGIIRRLNSDPVAHTQTAKNQRRMETPLKIKTSNSVSGPLANNSTTTTTNDHHEAQFATPQIRSFSVHRPRQQRDLCSTQKTRTAIVNEFSSQKVLFQTPMAMARTPMPNDSIALALCETINETGTPSTTENTPQACSTADPKKNATGEAPIRFKKSLEGDFKKVDKSEKSSDIVNVQKSSVASSAPRTENAATNVEKNCAIVRIHDIDYKIISKLGSGGSSSVYRALRKSNGMECALKVVDLRCDEAVVEGYLNETKLLAKLQGNVCVVTLFDYQLVRNENRLLLVMEKGNSDLHKILQSYSTNLPLYILMNYLYQMLQAVDYIHQNGVIHSDLKPANFLMVNGRLKLIDFGIASNIALDSTSIIKYSQAGTFNYISPEALTDTSTGSSPMRANTPKIKISTKSDVWSLGCIVYLFLYRRTPFSHITNVYAKITAISTPATIIEYPPLPSYYPAMLVQIVQSCLQHQPKKRPSCSELLQYPFDMVIPIKNLEIPATTTSQLSKAKRTGDDGQPY